MIESWCPDQKLKKNLYQKQDLIKKIHDWYLGEAFSYKWMFCCSCEVGFTISIDPRTPLLSKKYTKV